jgi:uncharacterized circularly permuted ATP-grasp superfamily protein/uncharacterized alpha-E superfamily protein
MQAGHWWLMSFAADSTTADSLFQSYTAPAGVYDEYFDADGEPRSAIRRLFDELGDVELAELRRRREQARQTLAENSVTFSAGEVETTNRPWDFDVLPLIIAAEDWDRVSSGLSQRARLLDLILADVYGPQRLLQRGLLPPQLIFSHPGYFRVFHGLRIPEDIHLHVYAADLARAPDGQWWVLADRTEAPSGMGYALENRLVSAGMYRDSFRAEKVERHAPFFLSLRERLQRLAPQHRDNPRIVLLSQGSANPNYFEDAYLSRYLGYSVVEGADLAVRNDEVLLKTLGGLLPVDVIFRRVDEDDCDPLELRSRSHLGAAGLVHAVRQGRVAMANALGSGLLECPAFPAFLVPLCRELLGEELRLPSVATWWCGEPAGLTYVLEHLAELVVRPTFPNVASKTEIGPLLSKKQLQQLSERIRHRPSDFVGQEFVKRSTAPVWLGDRLESWSVGLRTYLVSTNRQYHCLPGGLARVSPQPFDLDLSISRGAGAKDAWVLASGPVLPVSLLKPPGYIQQLKRSGSELPSRVADNLFWLGRHAERAEGAARLLRTFVVRLLSETGGLNAPEVQVLLRTLAETGMIEAGYCVPDVRGPLPAIEVSLPQTLLDADDPNSLRAMLSRINHTASLVRERLSLDSWRLINHIHQQFHPDLPGEAADLGWLLNQLNQLVIDLSALSGLVAESMTRTLGWRFLDMGRRVERSLHTLMLVRNLLLPVHEREAAVLEAALEVADSLLTYRSRYLTNLQMAPVLDLLLTDETNPRSVVFQLVQMVAHVEQLPRDLSQPLRTPEQRIVMTALHALRMVSTEFLISVHTTQERDSLDKVLGRLVNSLPKFCTLIGSKYLIHAGQGRQLKELRSET